MSYETPNHLSHARLDRLFRARSVALLGISADPRKLTGAPLRNIVKNRFPGAIYPVNPKYDRIADLPCYPSIESLPAAPDVALVMLPSKDVSPALRTLAAKGTRAAVVLSSGFEESENGSALAEDLRHTATECDMAVIGPNCEGLWSVESRLILTFGSAANRDELFHAPIAVISQSGAIAGGISRQLQDSGFGCAYVVSVGNETCIDALDVLSWTIEQADVRVVALFVEGLKRGARLIKLAARARARGIRIVALKSGNSVVGRAAVSSHTGKIASPYAIYRDLFRQAGIVQVEGLSELIEATEVLTHSPLPKALGRATAGVAVASIPGGTRALTADLCERRSVPLATFEACTERKLAAILPEFAYVKNPTDMTGQSVSRPELFDNALRLVAEDPNCEALIIQLANRGPSDLRERRTEIANLARQQLLPTVVSLLGDVLPAGERRDLIRNGIISARDPVDAVKYLDWLYTVRRGGQNEATMRLPTAATEQVGSRSWSGLVALLDTIGVRVPRSVIVRTDADLTLATALPMPVVVKAMPDQADHKTELGLVILGIESNEQLIMAIHQVRMQLRDERAPVLVQETVAGVEAVLSIVNDADFGPVLAMGSGGTAVELWQDIRYLSAPTTEHEIRRVLGELRLGQLLNGFRGRALADVDALVRACVALSELAASLGDRCPEIEINPLFVAERGGGVIAADILVTPIKSG